MTNLALFVACVVLSAIPVAVLNWKLGHRHLVLTRSEYAPSSVPDRYTPPSFAEFKALVGDEESTPFENIKLYDLMCLAMSCHTYDRDQALRRAAGIGADRAKFGIRRAEMPDTLARLRPSPRVSGEDDDERLRRIEEAARASARMMEGLRRQLGNQP